MLLGRRLLISGSFILGAFASAFIAWQLVPSEWTLPFWTTLQATVDSDTYGHKVEHYAECVVVMMAVAAALGGCACAGVVAVGTKVLRKYSAQSL